MHLVSLGPSVRASYHTLSNNNNNNNNTHACMQVTVDDFFLRYLGTEGLVIELNQARAADFELVGRRQIALSGLLSSRPRIVLQREPLISTRDGGIVGYVHVEVRWGRRRRRRDGDKRKEMDNILSYFGGCSAAIDVEKLVMLHISSRLDQRFYRGVPPFAYLALTNARVDLTFAQTSTKKTCPCRSSLASPSSICRRMHPKPEKTVPGKKHRARAASGTEPMKIPSVKVTHPPRRNLNSNVSSFCWECVLRKKYVRRRVSQGKTSCTVQGVKPIVQH